MLSQQLPLGSDFIRETSSGFDAVSTYMFALSGARSSPISNSILAISFVGISTRSYREALSLSCEEIIVPLSREDQIDRLAVYITMIPDCMCKVRSFGHDQSTRPHQVHVHTFYQGHIKTRKALFFTYSADHSSMFCGGYNTTSDSC